MNSTFHNPSLTLCIVFFIHVSSHCCALYNGNAVGMPLNDLNSDPIIYTAMYVHKLYTNSLDPNQMLTSHVRIVI